MRELFSRHRRGGDVCAADLKNELKRAISREALKSTKDIDAVWPPEATSLISPTRFARSCA
jgi:hypothetical protein